jgi:Flp pilus assembly protein TadB
MKTTYFITILFFVFSFCSFASESDSKHSNQKEITTNHLSEKSKVTTIKKQKKLNFKERLALKLVQHKIKKTQKKQPENVKSTKGEEALIIIAILISVLLILGGLIGGIIYLTLGETLLGILLLVGGLIFIPLILAIILVILISPIC